MCGFLSTSFRDQGAALTDAGVEGLAGEGRYDYFGGGDCADGCFVNDECGGADVGE